MSLPLTTVVFCCVFSILSFQVKADICDTYNHPLNDPIIEEFRAVWIATVGNMDWPSSKTATPAQQQQELIQILDTIQRLNMNVVIFHVIRRKNMILF